MGQINTARVIAGGIVGGIVAMIADYLLNGLLFQNSWNDLIAQNLAKGPAPQTLIPEFATVVVMALLGTYTYALARPRLGGNPRSAFQVALLVGSMMAIPAGVGMLIWSPTPVIMGSLVLIGTFIVAAVGTYFGAWVYKE